MNKANTVVSVFQNNEELLFLVNFTCWYKNEYKHEAVGGSMSTEATNINENKYSPFKAVDTSSRIIFGP